MVCERLSESGLKGSRQHSQCGSKSNHYSNNSTHVLYVIKNVVLSGFYNTHNDFPFPDESFTYYRRDSTKSPKSSGGSNEISRKLFTYVMLAGLTFTCV